jgi:hypothetical protein
VVVVLMEADPARTLTVGLALSADLGWPLMEAAGPQALHANLAAVLGRREHLVIASPVLSPDAQATVRGDLHGVRFVNLADHFGNSEEIIRTLKREFGL